MKNIKCLLLLLCCIQSLCAQTIDPVWQSFSFQAGETILFEDDLLYEAQEKLTQRWDYLDGGGSASARAWQDVNVLSFDAYYTRLKPKLFSKRSLPDDFAVEYDTWLDAAYDGNPGVLIVFETTDGKRTLNIAPNKHATVVTLPDNQSVAKDNPPSLFGEDKFYNRWLHVTIDIHKTKMTVWLDQYKVIDNLEIQQKPNQVLAYGDKMGEANNGQNPIYLKNFRITTGKPVALFQAGKALTHNIRFDQGKATLKPESIVFLNELKTYLQNNPQTKLAIAIYTDSRGDEEVLLKMSQHRADAVWNQLVSMGINAGRLQCKGFGAQSPLVQGSDLPSRVQNRRTECLIVQ